jgi:hypothetical protein
MKEQSQKIQRIQRAHSFEESDPTEKVHAKQEPVVPSSLRGTMGLFENVQLTLQTA